MEFFEEKLQRLESDEFDLKLQMYYTNVRTDVNDNQNLLSPLNNPEILPALIEDDYSDNVALREANEVARRRIVYLESELSGMKIQKAAAAISPNHEGGLFIPGIVSPTAFNSVTSYSAQVDENRRQERIATSAIAAHDAMLIGHLEAELKCLQIKHTDDMELVKESVTKIANLLKENSEKDLILSSHDAATISFDAKVIHLSAQLKATEMLLETERNESKAALESATAAIIDAEKQRLKDIENRAEKQRLKDIENRADKQRHKDTENRVDGNSQSTRSGSSREENQRVSNGNGRSKSSVTKSSTHVSSIDNVSHNRMVPLIASSKNNINGDARCHHSKSFMRSFDPEKIDENLHQINLALRAENEQLAAENGQLAETLEKERKLLMGQADALNQVRASAEEITFLEAEEIARLESELSKCFDEIDFWRKKCKVAETRSEKLSLQLQRQEQHLHPTNGRNKTNEITLITKHGISTDALDVDNATNLVDIGGGRKAFHPVEIVR